VVDDAPDQVLQRVSENTHLASSLTLVGRVRDTAVLNGELASSLTQPPR
jgi:hypothetical protein